MKVIALTLGGILVAGGIFQVLVAQSTDKTEVRPHRLVKQDGDFEIRFYPECNMASVKKDGRIKEVSNLGFRDLAGYIFGGNKQSQSIAMTSPVLMDEEEDGTQMSFVMPSEYDMQDLPEPNNPNVRLHTVPELYAATLRFGGFASQSDIDRKTEELRKMLEEKGLKHDGNFLYLGYNPPYQIIGRRNEIMVQLSDYAEPVK